MNGPAIAFAIFAFLVGVIVTFVASSSSLAKTSRERRELEAQLAAAKRSAKEWTDSYNRIEKTLIKTQLRENALRRALVDLGDNGELYAAKLVMEVIYGGGFDNDD